MCEYQTASNPSKYTALREKRERESVSQKINALPRRDDERRTDGKGEAVDVR